MKIDVHGHVVFEQTVGKAGEYGPELSTDDDGVSWLRVGPYLANLGRARQDEPLAESIKRKSNPHLRAKELDKLGVDVAGVTIAPLFYLYWAKSEIAIPFARLQNDAMLEYCEAEPSRFFPIVTLPLQDVGASLEELDRTAARGARGLNLGTDNFGGKNLDDRAYWPLYEKLVAYNIPLFIHPYPLPMADGRDDRYNISWVVGYPYSETLAFAHLTLGGVFDDFPGLKVYITHGGGNVPYQFGRINQARTTNQPGVKAKKSLDEYLQNFYFDVLVHDLPARKFLLDFIGVDNLVVGSNMGGWDQADGFAMLEEMGLSQDDREKVEWRNAHGLFRLESRVAGKATAASVT